MVILREHHDDLCARAEPGDKKGWRGTGFEADRAGPHAGDRLTPAAAFAVLDSSH